MARPLELSDAEKQRFLNHCPAIRGTCSDALAMQFELKRYERDEHVFLHVPVGPKPPLGPLEV